ncbi:MAG: aspartate aminotransferase family protein [Planctomycetia bacterium]|nr:aspartate aminotransferase family protein [Planctomycetia bacterium]
MSNPTSANDPLRAEGDVNTSVRRQDWQQQHLDAAARQLLAADEELFVRQSLSTPCLDALVGSSGAHLVNTRGHKVLDFHGNSAHQVGYGHPRVIDAIKQQLDQLPFCPRRFTNQPAVALAQRLVELTPSGLDKVLFAPAGTVAIGIALKLARYATRRYKTISMEGSFHGASLDAISVGGEGLFRDQLGPLLPGCFHVQWPRAEEDAERIEEIMRREGDIGAIIAEPMRCTTVDRPPDAYWRKVRELCDQHGAMLIFDEVPLALGRTGRMFCCEHSGVVPDVLVLGKGLGGGVMPLAAVVVQRRLDCVPERAVGHYTHEKSPVAAAAALATLDIIQDEELLARSRELGEHALARLRDLASECRLIAEVRGLGLAMAVELCRNGAKANDEAEAALYGCLSRGLSFKVSDGNVLTLMPPLVITQTELDQALDILAEALREIS